MSSNRDYREFNADEVVGKLKSFATVNLHDYKMHGDLARVVLSYTGDMSGDDFRVAVAQKFGGLVTPIKNSFKKLTANSIVGWISSHREVREYDEVEQGKKYRALASNILMDREDQTTWQLKSTESGGKYLCRQGIEDLSEIAQALHVRKTGIPTLAAVASAEVAPREFVAFVNKEEAEVDYGYVVGEGENGAKQVLSAITNEVTDVAPDFVIHATNLMGSDEKQWGKEIAAGGDKAAMVEYYKKAYSYAPEYIQEIIQMINQHAFA